MAVGTLIGSIASRVRSTSAQPTQRAECVLIELGGDTDSPVSSRRFQYFPETLSITKDANWQSTEIPGGSLPLYTWISSGERKVTFTATFSCDLDLDAEDNRSLIGVGGSELRGYEAANVDVPAALAWLEQYRLPTYSAVSQGRAFVTPPKKLRLYIPNSGLGLAGGEPAEGGSALDDAITCVMTSCDTTIESFFANGRPRVATVALSFVQLAQVSGGIRFPHAGPRMLQRIQGTGTQLGYRLLPRR